MSLNESIIEDAALTWFGELGYTIGHGAHLWRSKSSSAGITKNLAQSVD